MRILLIAALSSLMMLGPAHAADLGGNCCADLEERIAELEATTARKGNRKVAVTIYGQINTAILRGWSDGASETVVLSDNRTEESFVGFHAEAKINPGVSAGGVIEVQRMFNPLEIEPDDEMAVRQSYVYVKNATLGRLALGKQSTATDDIFGSVANTSMVVRPLTVEPLIGIEPFEGRKANVVRYDTVTYSGFAGTLSWSQDDDLEAALHWSNKDTGVAPGLRVYAAIGYRDAGKAYSAALSALHEESGLFASAYYGQFDYGVTFDAYHVMAGLERKLFAELGPTTLFVEFADSKDIDISFYGAGVVQTLLPGFDVYGSYRRYDDASIDGDVLMAGARVKF